MAHGQSSEPSELVIHREDGSPAMTAPTARTLNVGLAQIAPRLGDIEFNLDLHCRVLEAAVREGVDCVIFPELSLTGYFLKDLVPDVAMRDTDAVAARLAKVSGDLTVVVGGVTESRDVSFYNSALVIESGVVVGGHDKVYLPTYGLFDEQRYFARGSRFSPVSIHPRAGSKESWRIGPAICEDVWHTTSVSTLAARGVDAFVCMSSSPSRGVAQGEAVGSERSYDAMTRTYAQLHTAYFLYVNRVGYEEGVNFWGGSRVVAPDGSVVAKAGRDEELLIAQISLDVVRHTRIAYPLLRDERTDLDDCGCKRHPSSRALHRHRRCHRDSGRLSSS